MKSNLYKLLKDLPYATKNDLFFELDNFLYAADSDSFYFVKPACCISDTEILNEWFIKIENEKEVNSPPLIINYVYTESK